MHIHITALNNVMAFSRVLGRLYLVSFVLHQDNTPMITSEMKIVFNNNNNAIPHNLFKRR